MHENVTCSMEDLKLNPVTDTHALLESMLQKLQLSSPNKTSSHTNTETGNPTVELDSETGKYSFKPRIYEFGHSFHGTEQIVQSTIWNTWTNPPTQQSFPFKSSLSPEMNQPVKRVRKQRGSAKPKRAPLIWGECNSFTSERSSDHTWIAQEKMPRLESQQTALLEDRTTEVFSPTLGIPESSPNPPDLLTSALSTPAAHGLKGTQGLGQGGLWGWGVENEKNKDSRPLEELRKGKNTSSKKRDARDWALKVKERWKERRKSKPTRRDEEGQQTENTQMNLSPLSEPSDMNTTTSFETMNMHQEAIHKDVVDNNDDDLGSLNSMSDSLLSCGTSNLMEEIFSGTEWAQFLSVHSPSQDQSSQLETSQKTLLSSPVLTMHGFQTHAAFANQLQSSCPCLGEPEQIKKQSQFFQPDSQETQQNPCQNPPQEGTEDLIPLLDLSFAKQSNSFSTTSYGSLSRKREHWTRRRDVIEDPGQDMDTEDQDADTFWTAQSSNIAQRSTTSPGSSITLETAIKKRRMENTRRVRFSEEVTFLPSYVLPEDEGDEDDAESDSSEEPSPAELSPRSSFPKWLVSLKPKSAKYKF